MGRKPKSDKKNRPRITWDKKKLALLGTMADSALAERLGVVRTTVTNKRIELSIPAFVCQKHHTWTAAQRKLLGSVPDVQIAKKLGISVSQVSNYRHKLQIAAFEPKKPLFPEKVLKHLGVVPDSTIARKHRIPVARVSAKRKQLGIERAPHPGRGDLTLARRVTKDIGMLLDTVVASKHGVPVSAVRKYREVHGIAVAEDRSRIPLPAKALALLGAMSDSELARRYGGTAGLYRSRRVRAGIPSFQETSKGDL